MITLKDFLQDFDDYREIEKQNFNKMNNFYNQFIHSYTRKIDSKYIQLIRNQYRAVQTAKKPDIILGSKQYFRKDFHFDYFKNDFYRIIWDVDLLTKLIREADIKPQKLKVKELSNLVETNFIDLEKLQQIKKLKRFDPIILVSYSPLSDKVLIDGNHRLYSRKELPHSTIEAYILDDFFSLEAMAGDVFKKLFALHYNVTTIVRFFDDFSIQRNTSDLDKLLIQIK